MSGSVKWVMVPFLMEPPSMALMHDGLFKEQIGMLGLVFVVWARTSLADPESIMAVRTESSPEYMI